MRKIRKVTLSILTILMINLFAIGIKVMVDTEVEKRYTK